MVAGSPRKTEDVTESAGDDIVDSPSSGLRRQPSSFHFSFDRRPLSASFRALVVAFVSVRIPLARLRGSAGTDKDGGFSP
jgi:hypothetical protein